MSKIMYKGRSYANAGVSSDATFIPTADMTAAFDSDAHINSEDMTTTEVSDFVDGVGGGTGAFADKVIELGEMSVASNMFTAHYRKWESGIAEYWLRSYNSTGVQVVVWRDPIYYLDSNAWANIFGNLFVDIPVVTCTSGYSQFIAIYPYDVTKNGCGKIRFVTLSANAGIVIPYDFSIYAYGRWK